MRLNISSGTGTGRMDRSSCGVCALWAFPSRHSAPRRHHITTSPRRTSSPILQNLIFGTHNIVHEFEKWMSRRFLFERAFLKRSPSTVRKAITHLFDESVDIEARLAA